MTVEERSLSLSSRVKPPVPLGGPSACLVRSRPGRARADSRFEHLRCSSSNDQGLDGRVLV